MPDTATARTMCPTCKESLQIVLLLLSSVPLACGLVVGGTEGESVILPCSYAVKSSRDLTTMCWGRGSCPNSKCTDPLIWTDGHKVTYRSAPRYRLNNDITRGKISLTIANARMEDAGTYCCRIEHAGWFNDQKLNIELRMVKAITTTPPFKTTTVPPLPVRTTTPPPPPVRTTPPPVQTTTPPDQPAVTTTLPPSPVSTTTSPPPPTETAAPPTPPSRTTTLPAPTAPLSITPNYDINTVPDMISVTTEFPADVTSYGPGTTGPTTDYHSEMEHGHESLPEPDATPLEQVTSYLSNNEILGHLQQNHTTEVIKERRISFHVVIITISFLVVLIVLVPLLIIKCRGKKRGQYLSDLGPNLELVTHAEQTLSEDQEMDRAEMDEDKSTKAEDININTIKD